MSIFFEIADLSFELIHVDLSQVTPDIIQFFREKRTERYRALTCTVRFENYKPLNGDVVVQDPYRLVLKKDGLEKRVFFMTPYSDIYGVYEEVDENSFIVTTDRSVIDMRFVELLTLEKYLLQQNAFILHSCYVGYRNTAICFTAPSGTGKSTQGANWEAHMDAKVVNGDRSIVQYKDGEWLVHSLPFCGSSRTNFDESYPMKAVAIVNRDTTDHTGPSGLEEDLSKVMNEVMVNKWDRHAVLQVLDLVKRLFADGMIVNLYCTMKPEACYALREYLYHD